MTPLPTTPTTTPQPLDALLADRYRHMPHTRAWMRRTVQYVLDALMTGCDLETYAQIKYGFWYKVYIFTPSGALKCDSTGAHRDKTAFARRVVAAQDLRSVPLSAVMRNWEAAGLYTEKRPIDALLLQTWQACGRVLYRRGA